MPGLIQVPFGQAMVSRVTPIGSPRDYRTYGMAMPLSSHFRPATCEEADCQAYINGWASTFDLATDLGQKQYEYCRHDKERSFAVERLGLTLVRFTYGPGNRCFRSGDHKVPVGRPGIFTVRAGDWRAYTGPARRHTRADDWVDDMAGHLDQLEQARERG